MGHISVFLMPHQSLHYKWQEEPYFRKVLFLSMTSNRETLNKHKQNASGNTFYNKPQLSNLLGN